MKHMKRLALCLLLAVSLATPALAVQVPEDISMENVNGQQRAVKTYVLSPGADPEELKEPPFEYGGFLYTWAYTTKEEHPFLETKTVTETVTVETAKKDLSVILQQLDPTMAYDDGEYTGELALDHDSLDTQAAGYTTKTSTITETKVIGPVDRNDMSYVPATTVKNGRTLSLSNVEWQVVGTGLAGDALVPAAYQAVATYSGSSSYQVATGYVTTAAYRGEVASSGVDSVTYTVVYTGEKIASETPEETERPEATDDPEGLSQGSRAGAAGRVLLFLLCLVLAAALIAGAIFLYLRRKNVFLYIPVDKPRDYKLAAKFRVEPETPEVDIRDLDPYPEGVVAVEVKRPLAKKLLGREFTVCHRTGVHTYTIHQDRAGDWHEFDLNEFGPFDLNGKEEPV